MVQSAWDNGQPLAIHGLVYNLQDGHLKNLTHPLTSLHDFQHYHEVALANGAAAGIELKDRSSSEQLQRASMDQHVAHLSKNVMTFMSFESELVIWFCFCCRFVSLLLLLTSFKDFD